MIVLLSIELIISFSLRQNTSSLSRNQQTAPLPPSSIFLCFVSPCLQLFFSMSWSVNEANLEVMCLLLLLEIMHRGSYTTWLPVTLSVLDMITAARWRPRHWFRKFTVRFRPIRKEIVSWMYNNLFYQPIDEKIKIWTLRFLAKE